MKYEELRNEVTAAMKAQDKPRLSILRQVLADVDILKKNDPSKKEILEADVDAALKKNLKQTQETYEASVKAGTDPERDATLAAQIAVLEELLPEQLEGDALIARIDAIIAEIGASSMKDMGAIMGRLSAETSGNFDKGAVAAHAKTVFAAN